MGDENEYEIDKRYAKERKARRAQYEKIFDTVVNLTMATIFIVICITVFATAFFPQDIPVIGLITIIYSGVIFIGISLYHNKKVRELLKH